MTVRTTVLGLVLLVSFSVPFLNGYGQVNPRLSKQNLGFEKAKSLFDVGQYENAQLVIDGITRLPNINGILSRKEQEELKYMQVVCSLVRGEYVAVQDAKHLLQTAETKSVSSNLAYHLGHYYFGLARYAEAVDYLEMTDVLLLSNDQNERVQFEKGVSYFSQKKFDNASPYFKSLYQLKNSAYQNDVAYYLGFMSFAERKYSEALQLFLSIKDDVKYATVVPFYLGFIYHEKGEKELALKNGELYLKGGDLAYEKEMLQLLASIYFNSGDFGRMIDLYEKSLNKGVTLTAVQKFELGTGYFNQSKYTKAVDQLKPLSSLADSIGLHSMYILAQSYLGLNQKANARSSFAYCISGKIGEPKKEIAVFYHAKLSFELGFEDQGLSGLTTFFKVYPDSKYASEAKEIMLAHYAKTNNYKKAIDFLNSISNQTGLSPAVLSRIYFGRGMELINDLQYLQADAMMAEAAKLKDKTFFGPAIFWRGELAFRSENYDAAIRYFSEYQTLNANPLGEANSYNALYSLGYAYFEKEDYKKALSYFEKVQASGSEMNSNVKREALMLAADCLFMEKNIPRAKSMYSKAYQAGGEGADYALFQLSLIEGIKSPDGKIKLLKEAEQKFPNSDYTPLIYMELADTYLSEEEFTAAIPYLKRIPQLVDKTDEMVPDAILKLGIAYYNLNQQEEAIEKYRELIAAYPSSTQAAEALESAKILYVEQGQINGYEEFLKSSGRTLATVQKDSLLFQYVQNAYSNGVVRNAQQAMGQYLNEFPNGLFVVEVLHLQAESYLNEKDWNNAAKTYASLAAKGASRYQEKALRQASRLYFFELKDYTMAVGLFHQLAKVTSKSEVILEAQRGEVRAVYYLKTWENGVEAAEQLVANPKINPDDRSFAEMVLAYAAQSKKEFNVSSELFNRVIAVNRSGLAAEARYQLVWNAFEQGRFSDAEQLALASIESSGSYEYWITKSYLLLGKVFVQQKDFFNAKATLKSVVENCTIPDLKKEAEDLLRETELAEKNSNG
ncbi:MAG: hypothetical protein RLZZ595_1482 [Bacteroidota bacterium]|jgi:tetratricopeptide (TPR) repeat protein